MGYELETDPHLAPLVDCYWQAPLPPGHESVVYPSLPEPHLNLFFSVGCDAPALVKGLSSVADFLVMRSALFGVRLHARSALRLGLTPWSRTTNRIQPTSALDSDHNLANAARGIAGAASFPERVAVFRELIAHSLEAPSHPTLHRTADLVDHIATHFREKHVLTNAAREAGISRRTLGRWFRQHVGMHPKQLVQTARFHAAAACLHAEKDAGFFLDCGFFDQSHFIREFRSVTGMSPEKYLRTLSRLYNTP